MLFWTSSAQVGAKLDAMRSAEARLLKLAGEFGNRTHRDYVMELFDTEIPGSALPLKQPDQDGETLVMHGVRVTNSETREVAARTPTPLVLLHGYMNGALYFYRNIVGLNKHFQTVFSLDLMGWGLSSRPKFCLKDDSVESAEDFFVESLEAWRAKNKIEKMTLAGHSMGGYLSIAYCERYPERVERLILLSPVGVPERDQEDTSKTKARGSLTRRLMFSFFTMMFERGRTPPSFLRAMPERKSRKWIDSYIENRLPAISREDEREALGAYLHTNCMLPGSGEYVLNRVLDAQAFAKNPAVHRIPKLKVPHVSFLYGEQDWMDYKGGLAAHEACEEHRATGMQSPDIDVYIVKNAGHLLMLDNWEEFNSAVLVAGGGKGALSRHDPLPKKLTPLVANKRSCETQLLEEVPGYRGTSRVEVQA